MQPAAHIEHYARDVSGLVRREKEASVGDVLRAGQAPERHALGHAALANVGSNTGGRDWTRTTRARERSFSCSVSPGSARKVPLDCSPAITSATLSLGTELSTR